MFQEWNALVQQTDNAMKTDVCVIGEMVLVSDKVEQGIYECRINSNTSKPMIMTLKETINKIFCTLELNIKSDNLLAHFLSVNAQKTLNSGQILQNDSANMKEINDKVIAINDSINVIDQIAFQTNILSLNEAVEASKKANIGKNISSDMIDGYKELNDIVSNTITILEDVNLASQEQIAGIEQINGAITLLDRATQENASEFTRILSIASDASLVAEKLVKDAEN